MSSLDPLQSDRCAEVLKALGDPLRLKIIDQLRLGPVNVTELSTRLATEIVTVSHHLGILRRAGLVEAERHGRFIHYHLGKDLLESDSPTAPDFLNLGCCRLEVPKPPTDTAGGTPSA